MPAYQDDRDGTGIIYEWLQRNRASDSDGDGIACDSASNLSGYVPKPAADTPEGCPTDAKTWHGLKICAERPRTGYDRTAFGTGYSTLEDDIITALPMTMKKDGQVYTPYSCIAFDITQDGTAATDIEHIVSLAEAHDSRIADDRRREFASDLDNLTIADPKVNRSKGAGDAAEWTPTQHGVWFANQVIAVKSKYGLSVDSAERDALEKLLTGDGATLNCVDTTDATTVSNVTAAMVSEPSLSVADARVKEEVGATLAFRVTLGHAAGQTVTVNYASADGTATAGVDYTPTSGTLTFVRGETAKTVSVLVLDNTHDEGVETLKLALNNASGAQIDRSEAVGIIENNNAIPKAWLARFGRTVSEQVLEGVKARLEAPRTAGTEATLAGQRIGGGTGIRDMVTLDEQVAMDRAMAPRLGDWLAGQEMETGFGSRSLTGRELLTESAFALTAGTEENGFGSLWARAAHTSFDGRDGALTLDGTVTTGQLGADWAAGRLVAGLSLAHSIGEGDGRGAGDSGDVKSSFTGVYPYAGLDLTERVSVWGMAGYGQGILTLTPKGSSVMETDMKITMGAAGVRGAVLAPDEAGGLLLSVKADAAFTRTASEKMTGLASADADTSRLRLGLESSRPFAAEGGDTFVPSFELGVRRDGGDAETGVGVDLGGGVAYADPVSGLTLDLRVRALMAHEAAEFQEWGLSGSFIYDPNPSSERGLVFSLRTAHGAAATGGAEALFNRSTLANLAANDDEPNGSAFEAEMGYGLGVFGDRFTGTPWAGLRSSESTHDWRLGWRLAPVRGGNFNFDIGARRSEAVNDEGSEHSLTLSASARW